MKNFIYGMIAVAAILLTILIIATYNGKTQRTTESEDALSTAIEGTVQTLLNDNNYTVEDNQAFITDFIQSLSMQVTSDAEIKVEVLKADYEKGLLAIEVTEIFDRTDKSGEKTSVSCVRNIIFDDMQVIPPNIYTIAFLCDDAKEGQLRTYREYHIYDTDYMITPAAPVDKTGKGRVFKGWKAPDGSVVMAFGAEESPVEDVTYEAVWEAP